MIYGDISEKKYVHDYMKKYFGDEYAIKELGIWDCSDDLTPMINEDELICEGVKDVGDYPLCPRDECCSSCKSGEYIRFADFEIGEGRAFVERKLAREGV